ncbi:DUF1211 domain-containing protein [Oxalobacteraceae bacterium]|nr:DUF1211 domain-containing protein [Oxalobacteraceae bacterium]
MGKGRLEAFSDGVIAIIITIMVLELKVPHGADWAALQPLIPVLLSYVLSFVYVGIYWNNHHHLLHASSQVDGVVLWANLHLLFWLSLIPFATGWMGENHFEPLPVALYGFMLLMAAIAYLILQKVLIARNPGNSPLAKAVGKDGKVWLSPALYLTAIGLAYLHVGIALAIYVSVAVIWFLPERRIEAQLKH